MIITLHRISKELIRLVLFIIIFLFNCTMSNAYVITKMVEWNTMSEVFIGSSKVLVYGLSRSLRLTTKTLVWDSSLNIKKQDGI